MDSYIRYGLLAAWGLFGLALLFWWRRRHDSKHYPYSERAKVILAAIDAKLDLGVIYWSKSERRFVRLVITPEKLDGYSLYGFDHRLQKHRLFKVTRIRWLETIPAGTPSRAPSRGKLISKPMAAAIGLGVVGFGLLALALVRSDGPGKRGLAASAVLEPPTSITSAQPARTSRAAPSEDAVVIQKQLPNPVDPDDFLNAPLLAPTSEPKSYIVVSNSPQYRVSQVAQALQMSLRYNTARAAELEQMVRSLGTAVVWSGSPEWASRLVRVLENYDLLVHVEVAEAGGGAAGSADPGPASVPVAEE